MPNWGKYKESYRKEWESDQSLKTWITPVVGDDTKAFCKYCQSEIRAQLNDLKEHAFWHKCFQELAQGAIRLLVLPVSNAHVERAFSLVSLLKDDTRNRMGLPLLSSIMDVRTGLVRNGLTSATFKPPRQLLERFDSTIYWSNWLWLYKVGPIIK